MKSKFPSEKVLKDTYKKTYRMQISGAGKTTIRTSVPRFVVEREARKHGLSIEEFIEHFRVEWLFNGFLGFYGTFVRRNEEETD